MSILFTWVVMFGLPCGRALVSVGRYRGLDCRRVDVRAEAARTGDSFDESAFNLFAPFDESGSFLAIDSTSLRSQVSDAESAMVLRGSTLAGWGVLERVERASHASAPADSIDLEFRWFLKEWFRRCLAGVIESVLESHGPCESFDLSVVQIGLETIELRGENEM